MQVTEDCKWDSEDSTEYRNHLKNHTDAETNDLFHNLPISKSHSYLDFPSETADQDNCFDIVALSGGGYHLSCPRPGCKSLVASLAGGKC